jgi:RNA polymerase sigma factor (sigma-70 family)
MALSSPPGELPPEQLLLAYMKLIDKIIAYHCRRQRFSREEGEDFAQTVKLNMVKDDHSVIRKYEGRSSMETYLGVVIGRMMLDYLNHLYGKYRPSAEAKRLGPLAVQLERLLRRDGLTLEEACQTLKTNHQVKESRKEIEALAAKLPPRTPRQMEGEEQLEQLAQDREGADERALDRERSTERERIRAALGQALATLTPEERLILKMRSEPPVVKIARIAEILKLEAKPLYRRIEKIRSDVRAALERAGVSAEDVRDALGNWKDDDEPGPEGDGGESSPRVRPFPRGGRGRR